MPRHTGGNIDIVFCYTLIIARVDIAQMHNRIAHFFFSAFDVRIDHSIDAFVAKGLYVHSYAVRIRLARYLG